MTQQSPKPDSKQAPLTYRAAGVDIDAGNTLVERIKPAVKKTMRPEVLAGLGGFGALVEVPIDRYRQPVLVSGADGVGTKLKLAQQYDRHTSIGIDLVAMCVNDVLVQGAEPLYFLDYFACGSLDVDTAATVIEGIAQGCSLAGCALVGGETAEMPDMYAPGDYDLAGFCVGVAEKSKLIDGSAIAAGDVIIGLNSSGAHSNGYSLIRKVLGRVGDPAAVRIGNDSLLDLLMQPTRIYVSSMLAVLKNHPVNGMAHITGGGLSENIIRVVPDELAVEVDLSSWQRPPLFDWLAEKGQIPDDDLRRTFNLGIGYTLLVSAATAPAVLHQLRDCGEGARVIGRVVEKFSDDQRIRYLS